MDRIEAMKVLVHAAEAGSLSKAGRELGLPLATVSRKVSDLETQLGARLLVRSSKGLVPTPAGRSYLVAAKAILEQLDEAERAAAGEYVAPRGDLAVTAPVMFGRLHVLPVVTGFLRAHLDVAVALTLTDRIAHLVDDHIDVALRIGDLPDSGLTAVRLGTVRRVVCASPSYLERCGIPGSLTDLSNHSAISSDSAFSLWRFADGRGEMAPPMRSRLCVNSIEASIDAAIDGMGLIRVLSYQIADHVRGGSLAIVLQDREPPPIPVHMVFHERARIPLKLRAFIDFASPRVRERLSSNAI